ncbi:uncharacterized protein LOC113961883, partial [Neopelma chrysocephalum]|uniref:uncharacterized protein LOC113961883 n=1 Tax=Neopelma chrysocephalum TaxID=114329 RepID=UPI000FCCFCFD
VLDCLNTTEWGDTLVKIFSRCLRSKRTEMRRLVLRGLVVLSKNPVMADGMRSLTPNLVDLLWDTDGELVRMALSVLMNEIQDRDIPISTPTALQLAEMLQPLFGHDNIHVQLLSISLFQKVMELAVEESKKLLKTQVIYSLLPLFFQWHNENQDVAEASREALLRAARFLKRRDLVKLLKAEQPWRFSKCLLKKDRSQVVQYVHQALPYLKNPQQPLREAALKFMGEPQVPSPPHCSSAPAPAAAAAAGCGPGMCCGAPSALAAAAALCQPSPGASRGGKAPGSALPGQEGVWPGRQHRRGGAVPLGP